MENSVDFRFTKRLGNSIQGDFSLGIVIVDLCLKTDLLILILDHPDSLIGHYSLDSLILHFIAFFNNTFTL